MSRDSFENVNKLILQIYEAALEPELWRGIARDVSDLMHSGATQLVVLDKDRNETIAACSRLCQQGQEDYLENFVPIDLRVPKLLQCDIGVPILEQSILDEDEKQQNREVAEFLKAYDTENLTGANLSLGDNWIWFGTARKGTGNIYTPDELEIFKVLIPHIRKSLRLYMALNAARSQAEGLAGICDRKGEGVVLFNGEGAVVFVSDKAETLMKKNLFRLRRDRLSFADSSVNRKFGLALDRTLSDQLLLSDQVQDCFLVSDRDGNDYGIRLIRHQTVDFGHAGGMDIAVLLVIVPLGEASDYSQGEIDRFGDIFALTAAEKRVLAAVADFENLTNYAGDIGVQPDTLRQQLKTVMAKTGVRSQKDLIRRLDRFCFVQMR